MLTTVLMKSKKSSNTFLENCWFFAGYFHDSNWLVLLGVTKTNLNVRFLDSETFSSEPEPEVLQFPMF